MISIIRTTNLQQLRQQVETAEAAETARHAEATAAQTAEARTQNLADQVSTLRQQVESLTHRLTASGREVDHLTHSLAVVASDRDDAREEAIKQQLTATRAEGELATLRAQHQLDTEDRVALRALLRTARRQAARTDRVYLLYRHGTLHSVHISLEDAETAAEAEGAARDGWMASSAPVSSSEEAAWLICPQRVSGQ